MFTILNYLFENTYTILKTKLCVHEKNCLRYVIIPIIIAIIIIIVINNLVIIIVIVLHLKSCEIQSNRCA